MIITNPTVSFLYQQAQETDKLNLSSTNALLAYSGKYTGRCPESKRIVKSEKTKDIWWGHINKPITPELFSIYCKHAKKLLLEDSEINTYHIQGYAGWDKKKQQVVHVYCKEAYQAQFMKNMLVEYGGDDISDYTDFTIYNVGMCDLRSVQVPGMFQDPLLSDTLVAINIDTREMIIYGTRYAGEMKKGLLTWMMYHSKTISELCLHSSANKSKSAEDVSLFFGMSGTGKTTLSADPNRVLIGDDEHIWHDDGIYNIEGGCYAKCINLTESHEPEIFNAIKYGSVLENVVVDENKQVDFTCGDITQNTRCSYPLSFIPSSICENIGLGKHPDRIIFLTCDVLGILPALSKLNLEEAINFFLSGYTSKMTGTEEGINEPTLTFSACFGEPFLIWHPIEYAKLLRKKVVEHNTPVWLINTGWSKDVETGKFNRIPLKHTRKMVDFIHKYRSTEIKFIDYTKTCFNRFNFYIPQHEMLDDIPENILFPHKCWSQSEWQTKIDFLSSKFADNWVSKIKPVKISSI